MKHGYFSKEKKLSNVTAQERIEAINRVLVEMVIPAYKRGDTRTAQALETLVNSVPSTSTANPTPSLITPPNSNVRHAFENGRYDLFTISGLFNRYKVTENNMHFPFLVFIPRGNDLELKVVYNLQSVLALPGDTTVLVQWKGARRSDFFRTTVDEIRANLR